MLNIKVILANDDYFYTKINCNLKEAEAYYVGKVFNVGRIKDNLQKCIKIEKIN